MPLDFSGQSLVGQSFKGKDLTGANFAFADIRSVNFEGANLSEASFYRARAGISRPWQIFQMLTLLVCSGAVGLMSVVSGAFNVTFGGTVAGVVLLAVNAALITIAGLLGGRRWIGAGLVYTGAIATLSYPVIYTASIRAVATHPPGLLNRLVMLAVVAGLLLSGSYIANRVLAKDSRFELIHQLAISFTTLGGTRFQYANLTGAAFTEALLPCTRFSSAQLYHTRFYQSQQLDSAQFSHTILANATVRQLAVTYDGENRSYQGLNLQGIHLQAASLTNADFTDSNLDHALLVSSNLVNANLTRSQAIGTHFQLAHMTGCCLEAWNIDSTTQLDQVKCQYLYLRSHQQERRPSSGLFKPSEFTKLFQQIVDTIDLIFQDGIDWQVLHTTLAQAEAPSSFEGTPLTIRSIENKGDGFFVVRVNAPKNADKGELHQQLQQHYQRALCQLKADYEEQLQTKDQPISAYRDYQTACQSKLVTLKLNTQNSAGQKIQATLQIGHEGHLPFLEQVGTLPSVAPLLRQYQQWQRSYRHQLSFAPDTARIYCPPTQTTNISLQSCHQALQQHTDRLHQSFNDWLTASEFRPLRESILENLSPTDTIRIVLSTDHAKLWQLPWQDWDLLSRYPEAEITYSTHQYEQQAIAPPITRSATKILCILGNGNGININADCQLLKDLPHTQVTVLSEPTRQALNDCLWEQSWDILFFAGHSHTQKDKGYLRLNATDNLSPSDISHALRKAKKGGLQLAIFNSCDGLGLAQNLSHLCLPQIIVMREPIPDMVAQAFLKGLLTSFSGGQPLPQAVREAREKLQGLEDRFPCATWLPVLCQAAATPSLTWQMINPSTALPKYVRN